MEQSDPLITVLLLNHLKENQPYLDLAMEGLAQQEHVPFEVILLTDADGVVGHGKYENIRDKSLDTATKKVHRGVKLAHPKSKYFFIHSDDVVLSPYCLSLLASNIGDAQAIVNPISNGEQGSRFCTPMYWSKDEQTSRQVPQSCTIEELGDWKPQLMKYASPFQSKYLYVKQDWLCFYSTLIPRTVWEKVGELDPALEVRNNDVDYCLRAKRLGIPSFLDFSAFSFHFGSRTLSKTVKPGEEDAANAHFMQKIRPC